MAPRGPDGHDRAERVADDQPGRLRGADAFRLHLTLALGLSLCIGAFIFEVTRALGGNTLSWAYVFEWPIFGVFAVYMWWNLLHGNDGSRRKPEVGANAGPEVGANSEAAAADAPAGDRSGASPATPTSVDDPDLVAWQAYVRTMEADEARQSETEDRRGS